MLLCFDIDVFWFWLSVLMRSTSASPCLWDGLWSVALVKAALQHGAGAGRWSTSRCSMGVPELAVGGLVQCSWCTGWCLGPAWLRHRPPLQRMPGIIHELLLTSATGKMWKKIWKGERKSGEEGRRLFDNRSTIEQL